MDEFRFKRVEMTQAEHARRLDKSEGDIAVLKQILEENKKTNDVLTEVAQIAKETLDVIRPMLKTFRWIGVAGKYCAQVTAGFLVCWYGIKWAIIHVGGWIRL